MLMLLKICGISQFKHFSLFSILLCTVISILSVLFLLYVSLEHKTSHKGQFCEIEIYTSYKSWINNLSIGVWFVMIGQYL